MGGIAKMSIKEGIILLVICFAIAIFINNYNSKIISSIQDTKLIDQVYIYNFMRNNTYIIDQKKLLNVEDKKELIDIIKHLVIGSYKEKKIYEYNALMEYKMLNGKSIKLNLYFDSGSDIIIIKVDSGGLLAGFHAFINDEEGAYQQELIKLLQE
ncbi:hypothetical protein [Spirochaeta cellobiosiphila]|uniref:hypothetical protein n=1 Tax=Spirochaeta cellobiosiphila TaxID=504483 RepID=UPI00040A9EB1|nr:hypothetical protein [Spirochaeta cellobiosiphila]